MELVKAKKLYVRARKAYYNKEEPILTDAAFDELEDEIRALDPDWKELHKTGVKSDDKKTDTDLEHFMPSLNKQYPADMPKWLLRPLVQAMERALVMDKLDGTSLQLIYDKKKPVRLITRGDGETGGDVSFMIPWLVDYKVIPSSIPVSARMVFRCEALMTKKKFDTLWSTEAKGENGFANARNMVNGLFNRRDKHPALKHVSMVVLGVYGMAAHDGLKWASEVGFEAVCYSVVDRTNLSADSLSKLLERSRRTSAYEMDGLVLMETGWIYEYRKNEKPKHLPTAFKVNAEDSAPEVELLSLIWQKTRTGRWQPVFEIPPTEMDGAIVTRVTGNNPQWLLERGVGVGGVVKVLRSGGVIPKIVGVVRKAKLTPPPGPYKVKGAYWMIDGDQEDPMVRVRAIHHMLVTLGVENVAEKTVIKLHDCGLFKTKGAYIVWKSQPKSKRLGRLQIKAGLGPRQAEIVDEQIVNAMSKTIPLRTLMVASGFFDGLGDRKLKMIEDHGISMDVLNKLPLMDLQRVLDDVSGFSEKTILKIEEGMAVFRVWMTKCEPYLDVDGSLPKKATASGSALSGKKVCFTGYRDKEQAAMITAQGGEVVTSFSGSTNVLLYSSDGKKSTKVDKAGERAYTWHQLRAKFGF